ncbi:MAG: hypothetical protein HC861_07980 [Rhodospirillaceae bacterium]|nr:hypothetical protein [Rhodospirillaceae bacterium]
MVGGGAEAPPIAGLGGCVDLERFRDEIAAIEHARFEVSAVAVKPGPHAGFETHRGRGCKTKAQSMPFVAQNFSLHERLDFRESRTVGANESVVVI